MCLRAGALLLFLSLCVNNSVIQTIVLGSYQDTEKYMTFPLTIFQYIYLCMPSV